MYAVAIDHTLAGHHLDLLTKMFELRRRVLANRHYDTQVSGDVEFDIYDMLKPTYLLVMSEEDLVGCVRLLPTTGPTMLRDTFATRLGPDQIPSGPTILESSRFCIASKCASDFDRNGLSRVAYVLFAAMIETMWNLNAQSIVLMTDLRTEHGLNRAGWPMRRLGSPQISGGTTLVPGLLQGSSEALERMYRHANVR
ncbi:acyl-homoserine-lactone synthase [Bradyrhizobium sp. BR 10261]|uniref:acyl-homoserine-lactone synthase n=1 Tax=Bradyrhizobium sp. BR 10261 TaxID=2749992 RepID=UPI001C648429|nr:acyl-homoserine-lactone synthase [Bradyrhizobium sp. BR 10261]MBW7966538.1 GNAT family N-acetyltransferase [Bradyrhizobium sp. BR 10261]